MEMESQYYLVELESNIASINYIKSLLEIESINTCEDKIREAIKIVIANECKDSNNNYTGSKRLLTTRLSGTKCDFQKIKEYVLNNEEKN